MKKTIFQNLTLALLIAVVSSATISLGSEGVPPIADAGLSRYAGPDPVVLDGTGSYDPDESGPLSYTWQQISGPTVVISDANTATPTVSGFIQTEEIQECEFELVVSNGELTSSLATVEDNPFNHGVIAGAYWSVVGPGRNLQLASTPDVETYKFTRYGDEFSGYTDFFDESLYPGRLPEPVTLIEPVYTEDSNGIILTCQESENAVGYQLLFGPDPYRVMDYSIISDTPVPPNDVITMLPFEETWWTIKVRDQYGSTIYADPNLVAWWKLDGEYFDLGYVVDYSGYNHYGTPRNDVHPVEGYDGGAAEFDGFGDYINIDGYKGIVTDGINTSAFTITVWIKATGDGEIVGWGSSGNGNRAEFRVNDGRLRYESGGGNVQADTNVSDNRWHHAAVTIPENAVFVDVTIYLDGKDDTQPKNNTNPVHPLSNYDVIMGQRYDRTNSRWYTGAIDDVRIYNRVLRVEEVAALAQQVASERNKTLRIPKGWQLEKVVSSLFLTQCIESIKSFCVA